MNAYTNFASVYDQFMDNIPYQEWASYVCELLNAHHIDDGLILDLGCGTGSFTEIMTQKGFEMIGVDNSADMLQIAIEKKEQSGNDILYLLQDMTDFELYGTVNGVICICDSINYILSYHDLVQVFKLVNNYLNPGGVFIFDFNTIYKYEIILGDSIIAEDRSASSFIWDNYFDHETMINEYALSLFIQEKQDIYRKYEEVHYQKAYSLDQMKQALTEAGMIFINAFDAFTNNPPNHDSERVYVIAKESGKSSI